jgi:flagellar secretion chaperone FliS
MANSAQAYRSITTQTASPGQLVLMLFDGALKFLERARAGFQMQDPLEFNRTIHNNVVRSQAILGELNACLDMDAGGELSRTLRRLYVYFDRRLQESNRRKQPQGIDEVIARLTELRSAWAQMLEQQATPAGAAHVTS